MSHTLDSVLKPKLAAQLQGQDACQRALDDLEAQINQLRVSND
jgi:hypothetical protein